MIPSPTIPLRFTVNAPHENMGRKSNAMKYYRLPLLASLLIPLASPAEEGLLPPPSDANDYVRVWSETIGVENVIRADRAHQLGNSLDFYITTTNVLDGFKALVRLEEINGDAWKLTSPGSGVPVPMRPGERIEYVVADRTGTEQHLPGHVALYRVDVRIGDMDEPFEETVGASLFHKDAVNGYDDPTLREFLVPVTIRCFTPDISDAVSIEAETSQLLVRNAAGELHEALSAYTAAELGTLEFFLLGTTLSTTDRDQAVRVVHVKTQCHDEARFTVRPKSEFCIRTVSFWNDVAIASDLGVEFVRPQYKDDNANGILDGSEDHAWPVCYVRNTRPSIQATLACADASQSGSVLVRAEATGFALPATFAFSSSPAMRSTASATIVLSTVIGPEQHTLEPGARNSNLLPVKANGEVRLRSVVSRGRGGSVSTPILSFVRPAARAEVPVSMAFITAVSSSPRKMEMMAGGASFAPRRWSLPAPAVIARRMSACLSMARITAERTVRKIAFSFGFEPGSRRLRPL